MARRRKILLIIALTIPEVGLLGWAWWNSRQTLATSAEQVRRQNEVRFVERPLERTTVAGVESISSAAAFVDGAIYQNKLWIISSDALWEYSSEGQMLRRYQVGIDLPPAPLTRILPATIAGVGEPVLSIATLGAGVVTYDGKAFRQLVPENAAHRKVTALLPLSTGELLLGTDKAGVLAWDGRGMRHYHESLRNLRVTTLAGDLDNLWVGTMDRGMFFLRAGEILSFDDKNGLPDAHVLSAATSEGRSFAGTSAGIAEFRAGKLERVLAEGTFSRALQLLPERLPELLLVGTLEEGIVEVPLAGRQPRPQRSGGGIANQTPVSAFLTSGGTTYAVARDGVWARGASGADVNSAASWRKVILAEPAALADHNISTMFAEDSGRLWIGYFDRGLDLLTAGAKTAIHHEDDHLFCVNRVLPTKDGSVVATANGLVFTDGTGAPRRVMGRKEGLLADHVTDIVFEGSRLIAATPAGVTFLDAGGPQSITAFHGLVNNHVYSLATQGTRLLIGTLGGVSVLDNGRVQASFTTGNSALRHNWISALARVENEWFAGTYGAGVFRFDGREWHSFPDLNERSNEGMEVNPNAMAVTSMAVYAGTLGRGLAVYRRETGRWTFQTAGLPSANVTAVSAANGFLYIGTDNGLVRMVERNLP